ncbi:hypothetical protein [uncultured Rikenella sp.]|uniref:phage tail terminator protein n=1 Tax=uncultured Rikenella sp. TaxID=368003 RepID=UPI002623071E|nr:hypothetical protein [uncultured Rikenella sp.]
MEEIYRNVCERLRTNVPGLKTVTLDCGQIDDPSGPALTLPAALVDVTYPECSDITCLVQRCRVTVSVRVALRAWPDVTDPAEELGLTEEVCTALQGWTDDTLSCLSRTSAVPEQRHDGLKVYRLEFDSAFEEEE